MNPVQEQLGEAIGLAKAARVAVARAEEHVGDADLLGRLRAMRHDADDLRAGCVELATRWGDEVLWDVLAHAASVERKAGEMLRAWVRADASVGQRLAFLAMGEAGEVATWLTLGVLGRDDPEIVELVERALAVQERHLRDALEGCTAVAAAGRVGEPSEV